MRKLFTLLICVFCILSIGCGGETTVNARNNKVVFKSFNRIKKFLPNDERLEFEIAFYTVRDSLGKSKLFLRSVDGKNVEEIIVLGQEHFNKRKAEGIPAYDKYSSWEDMLTRVKAERAAQSLPKQKITTREQRNNLNYNPSRR